MVQYFTLIFITKDGNILLGYKKRGLGEKLWNGFGGKIEMHENVNDCVIRELQEECGLKVHEDDLMYLGYVNYIQNGEKRTVYIYTSEKFSGDPQESEEMKPSWFKTSAIPYEEMWPDSRQWMHLVLTKSFMQCEFIYSSDGCIEKQSVKVLPDPPVKIMNADNNNIESR